jgi:predicted PurR-regulated permease PerM
MKPETARTLAVLAIAAACLHLLAGLLAPIAWSALIALSTWSLRQRLLRLLGPRHAHGVAALLTACVVLVLLLPLGYLVYRGLLELPALLHWWGESQQAGLPPPEWLGRLPVVGDWAQRQWNAYIAQPGALRDLLQAMIHRVNVESGRALVLEVGHRTIALFFCALVLFFLYLDGEVFGQQAEAVLQRQFGPDGVHTMELAVAAVRGTVNGLVLVGLGMALVMSVAYAVAGVPHPAVWGLVTGLLGMVPFGATVALAGVALYLLAMSASTAAVSLLVFGVALVFIVDHFIRPAFIAGTSKLPMVLALLGVVGGLETFGVLGIFVGPTLLAVLAAVWRQLAAPGRRGALREPAH